VRGRELAVRATAGTGPTGPAPLTWTDLGRQNGKIGEGQALSMLFKSYKHTVTLSHSKTDICRYSSSVALIEMIKNFNSTPAKRCPILSG
jgi:hypothetical protein